MEAKPTNGFVIRPFQPADASGVRSVLKATYGAKATPPPIYDWWSFGFAGASSGFMVAEIGRRIAGVQPMEIFPFWDGTRQLQGGLLTGVAVHPEFQRRGIFSALVRACEGEAWRHGAAFVTTMPNEKSRPGFLKAGYTDLGQRQLLVRPLRPCVMGGKKLPIIGHLVGAGALLAQFAVKRLASSNGVTVREAQSISTDTEALVLRHEMLFPGLRMCRSADWLGWRFMGSPLKKYRMFEARNASGQLAGWVASTIDEREKFKVCYVMDLLVNEPRIVGILLGQLCRSVLLEGVDAVATVVSSKQLAEQIRRSGFWSVPAWFPVKRFYSVARFNPAVNVPADWRTLAGWYQTLGDWDNL